MSSNILVTTALLAMVSITPALAQEQVPASLESFKPHEVVEAFTTEAETLALAPDQLRRLDSLHLAVRDERHRWAHGPGIKAHETLKMKPMISRERAYADALSILTPDQRQAVVQRFEDPDYVPSVPSLASTVPTSLESLKPHEIVQGFVAERQGLGLTDDQVKDLQALHVAVRDEPHRYTEKQHGGKGPRHLMMEPMISKRRAYNDALSYLTPEQQKRADKQFRAAGYKPALDEATKQ
jgi:hypothetical protein